jgi:hypothetical protein
MSDLFRLGFDPKPSPNYPHGYWYAYAEPGFDAAGDTPEAAMAGLIIEMAEALSKESK